VDPPDPARHDVSQNQQILHAKVRPPAADAEVRIGGHDIGPIEWHRARPSIGMLEGHAILSPERLGDDEPKGVTPEGMKRVRDANQRRISQISGS
jgi:hypothetical protein